MVEELPSSYSAAATALRAKRQTLGRELLEFLRSARSDDLPTIDEFREKKAYFEELWNDVVKESDNCISLINPGEDQDDKKAEGIKDALEDLLDKKERLNWLEEDIMRKTVNPIDSKSVGLNVSDGSLGEKTMSSIESDSEFDVLAKKVVNPENVQASDIAESSVLKLPNHDKDDLNLSGKSRVNDSDIIGALKDMGKSFYAQLNENNAQLSENMYAQLNENNAQLSENMNHLSENMYVS